MKNTGKYTPGNYLRYRDLDSQVDFTLLVMKTEDEFGNYENTFAGIVVHATGGHKVGYMTNEWVVDEQNENDWKVVEFGTDFEPIDTIKVGNIIEDRHEGLIVTVIDGKYRTEEDQHKFFSGVIIKSENLEEVGKIQRYFGKHDDCWKMYKK